MKSLMIFIYISCISILSINQLSAQWNLEKNEDGIKIFTRKVDGSSYKEFKAVMEVENTADEVLNLIKDADNLTKWIHNCISSNLVKRIDETEQYNYTVSELPFPFENRDMVFRAQFSKIENKHFVSLEGMPDYIPKKSKITRMSKAKGSWVIEELESNKTKVTYQLWVEPGGSLPSWLANLKVVEIPYQTLINMRKNLNV